MASLTQQEQQHQEPKKTRRKLSLIQAAKQGDFTSLQNIIQDLKDSSSSSPILIDDETDDRKEVGGSTALLWASASGSVPCVELLLQNGANIRHTSKIGWTALICAAQDGNEQVVRLLLNNDPSLINHKDVYGNTALHWACFNAFHRVVKCLLEYGANPLEKNHFGQIPEQCIGKDKHIMVSEDDKEKCKLLLSTCNTCAKKNPANRLIEAIHSTSTSSIARSEE